MRQINSTRPISPRLGHCGKGRGSSISAAVSRLRRLELEHSNFIEFLKLDRTSALAQTTEEEIPFLYWAGVSWAGALSAAKDDLTLIGDLPLAGALVHRVLELDETYDRGAAHEFLISYEGSRPGEANGRHEGTTTEPSRSPAASGPQCTSHWPSRW